MNGFSRNQAHKCHYRSGLSQYVFRIPTIADVKPLLIAASKKDTQATEVKASPVIILVQALVFEYQKALCVLRFFYFLGTTRCRKWGKSSLKPQTPTQNIGTNDTQPPHTHTHAHKTTTKKTLNIFQMTLAENFSRAEFWVNTDLR